MTHRQEIHRATEQIGFDMTPNVGTERLHNKPLLQMLDQNKSVPNLFLEFVNRLARLFPITRAALTDCSLGSDDLKIVAMWDEGTLREGVSIAVPEKGSLQYSALAVQSVLVNHSLTEFPGNWIEKRVLTTSVTSALAVCPLMTDGLPLGMICLASDTPFAFESLEEHCLDDAFERFAQILLDKKLI